MAEDNVGGLLTHLLKHLSTRIKSPIENEETQITLEEAIALETYHNVYRIKYRAIRTFSNKQIAQIYQSLLSWGDKYVRSSRAWRRALILEARREERFVMRTMTSSTRKKFLSLMHLFGLPLRRWYILVTLISRLRNHMTGLPDGRVSFTKEFLK